MKTQLLQSCRWVGPFRQGLPSQSSQCTSQPSLRTRPTIPMPTPTIPMTCHVFVVAPILATAFCVIRFSPIPKFAAIPILFLSTIKQILGNETTISHPATHKSKPEIVKSYLEMMINAISGYIPVMPLPSPVAIYIIMCIPTASTLHSSVGALSALLVPIIPLLPPIIVLFPPITTPILTIIPHFLLQFKKILNNDRKNDIFISCYQILMLTFASEMVLTGPNSPRDTPKHRKK